MYVCMYGVVLHLGRVKNVNIPNIHDGKIP
jgi:hypothetical protein